MEKGTNYNVEYLLRYIGKEKQVQLETFVQEMLSKKYQSFNASEDIINTLGSTVDDFISQLSSEEAKNLRSYTGYQFRNINAVLRNNWNYEVNGRLTDELKKEYNALAENIHQVLNKTTAIPTGIKTYRGVSIQAFQSYGIFSLNDLVYLEGKYLYEEGFTSTSLIKEKCFYYTDPFTLTGKPNILIEYLIPENSDDGIALLSDNLSYSTNQTEFLLRDSSLFKVISVSIDTTNNVAFMKLMLIPERIWNYPDYEFERNEMSLPK